MGGQAHTQQGGVGRVCGGGRGWAEAGKFIPPTPSRTYGKNCKPTFLPPPHCDCMFRIHSYRHQKFACSTEIDIVHPFGMKAAQHRQSLLSHSIPDVDRRSCAWIFFFLKKEGIKRELFKAVNVLRLVISIKNKAGKWTV